MAIVDEKPKRIYMRNTNFASKSISYNRISNSKVFRGWR